MLHKVLASLLALFTIAFCPAAFAGSYGEVQLAPSYKATYCAASAYFTPVASATDLALINGSASKTIRVLKIFLNYKATAAGSTDLENFQVIKRSAANSGGTATTLTNVPLNSTSAAASAVAKNYTANPTPGATVGTIATGQCTGGAITGDANTIVLFDADKYGQACDLIGTAQGLAVNHNGVTVAGTSPLIQVTFVWTEE